MTSSQPVYQRLTFRRGTILTARFAPDGKTVVYGAAWAGKPPETFAVTAERPESRALGIPKSDVYSVSSNGELAISLRTRARTPRRTLFPSDAAGIRCRSAHQRDAPIFARLCNSLNSR